MAAADPELRLRSVELLLQAPLLTPVEITLFRVCQTALTLLHQATVGYVFTPASQPVNLNSANATANFTSTLPTFTISGTITGPGGVGATVNLSGASTATTTTDGSGNYSFSGLANGSYTVSASNGSYVITPTSQTVMLNGSNGVANFTSSPPTYSLSGTISGAGGANATVTLNGVFAATATADASGNYSFSGLPDGSYFVSVGNPGYVFTPASQDVVINNSNYTGLNFATVNGCPTCDTIWPASATPLLADGGDPTANELGVKFRADSDGYITGLRFYKAFNNTGTHVAHLWTSTGTLLGTATFTVESAVGWQQVLFAAPLPVLANTTYVASYFAPSGHHSENANYFVNSGVDNAPLHALADGTDGPNGVYLATTTGGFPTSTSQSTNYWVDVVYSNGQGYSIVGTISGPGGPGATVNVTGAATATATADANGNYTLSGLANGTYTVTPTLSGVTFSPGSQTVTVNSAHVLNVNFDSSTQTYSITGAISGPGGAGATVSLTGASSTMTTADGSGNYSFTGLLNGTYTVTPSNQGFVFNPASHGTAISGSDVSGLNFASLPTVASVALSPASVIGGGSSTGTVTLSGPAPAGGAIVGLSSSNTAAAQVPPNVTVAANATTATFAVNSSPIGTTTPLTISATYGTTRNVSFTVTAPVVTSLSLNPASVQGGNSTTGTVTLSGPAPTGGAVVALASSNPAAAQVPANVTVAANATTGTFTVTTSPVATSTSLAISGTFGTNQSANLTVTPPALTSLSLNPVSVPAGATSIGTVTLGGPAAAGGAMVALSSSNQAAAQVPASVTVPANATTATFTVTTSSVTSSTSLIISGTYGSTQTASFTVTSSVLSTVTRNPASVVGGTSSTGTVTLTKPAPAGGAVVTLSSSNTAAAQVPASVTVPAGATTATFTVTTSPVASNTSVTISGVYGVTRTTSLTVTAATLSSVTRSPTSVIGGTSSTGTVTLNGQAPAGGAVVTLSSSNTAAAQVPASVTVPAGATTATFTVTTSPMASNTSVTISGIYGVTRTTTLTVTAATLSSVTLNPTSVVGGNTSTGTLTLNGPAPAGGSVVTLSSSNTAAAQVPASVTVAANATTATFTVSTSPVASNASVTISGTYGATRTSSFTVLAAVVNSVTLSPTSVLGGNSSTGTVTLSRAAPAGGSVVTLSSNNTAAAQVPASVTVAANATTATFTVSTSPVASNASVTISGTYGATKTAIFTVTAATLSSVTLSPTSVIGGTSSTGTVTLNGPAPSGGAVVTLSSNKLAAQVPASVTVAANATTATFTVTTSPVATNASVTIKGTRGVNSTATLTVTAPTLSVVTLNPTTVKGPSPSTGTVTLSGPAPSAGTVVALSSNLTSVATVPANVTVAAGATSATFTVTTKTVTSSTSVAISATKGGTLTATLTVTP